MSQTVYKSKVPAKCGLNHSRIVFGPKEAAFYLYEQILTLCFFSCLSFPHTFKAHIASFSLSVSNIYTHTHTHLGTQTLHRAARQDLRPDI